jgi:hypothetical protein
VGGDSLDTVLAIGQNIKDGVYSNLAIQVNPGFQTV